MIDPRVASGLRDLLSAVMIPRERMLGASARSSPASASCPSRRPTSSEWKS